MVKSGLMAAIEGSTLFSIISISVLKLMFVVLPRSTMFGLVVFSDTIGIYDLRAPLPHVKYVNIPPANAPSLIDTLPLEDILPVASSLVQVSFIHFCIKNI